MCRQNWTERRTSAVERRARSELELAVPASCLAPSALAVGRIVSVWLGVVWLGPLAEAVDR